MKRISLFNLNPGFSELAPLHPGEGVAWVELVWTEQPIAGLLASDAAPVVLLKCDSVCAELNVAMKLMHGSGGGAQLVRLCTSLVGLGGASLTLLA